MKDIIANKLEPFIFLYITERCQLRCRHCYMGDRLSNPKEMSLEKIIKILNYFKVIGHYKLYLLGGEPLLHPQIKEIITIANKIGYEVVVTSNGQFDKKILQDYTPELIHSFSFSIESSNKKTHDYIRGKGTFKRLIDNIKIVQSQGYQARIVSTVSNINVNKLTDLIDYSARVLKVSMLSFHYFSPIGQGEEYINKLILPEDWINFCKEIEEYPIPENFWVYYPPTFVYSDELSYLTERGYKGCTARWVERLAILPSGQIYACSVFFDTNMNFALWRNKKMEIRDSKNTELRSVYKVNDNCMDCPNKNQCFGGCGAYRDLKKKFPGIISSDNCKRKIIPLCPLWSTYAGNNHPISKIQELR
ncbi:MAG: radical SAM domain-containing protein [Parcubacteria group bacterium Athens1014_10]|nr:MAG: radical SAM domain-containing protein [Parcubacteria group bacterium Athens1014_10]